MKARVRAALGLRLGLGLVHMIGCDIVQSEQNSYSTSNSKMALRRHVRLRREYLYRKSLEGKEKEAYEKKRAIKQAIEEG